MGIAYVPGRAERQLLNLLNLFHLPNHFSLLNLLTYAKVWQIYSVSSNQLDSLQCLRMKAPNWPARCGASLTRNQSTQSSRAHKA